MQIPITSGESDGGTSAATDGYDVSTLALLGRVFEVTGSSSGPSGGCEGGFEVVFDDVNPFLTVLGGGGLAAAVIGLIALAWAVRNPTGLRRRIVGLLSLALIGAGGSLVLQQTSTPGAGSSPIGQSVWVDSVAGPTQVSLDPMILLQALILTFLIVVLIPFPSELFNRTLEENEDSIRSGLRRLPLVGRSVRAAGSSAERPRPAGVGRLLFLGVFVLASGLLYSLLDPNFGLDARSLVTFAGITAALVAVTWAAALPGRAIHRTVAGDAGWLRAVGGTLAIAGACVVISRLAGFLPGYLYGLILGYSFAKKLNEENEGRAAALGAWWMIALSLVAWFTLGAVRTPGIADTLPAQVAASVLAALVVAGVEGIVFGFVPLRFLPGEHVFQWQRVRWAVLYAIGVFGFLFIILNPENGFLDTSQQGSSGTAAALFIGFGLVSVLFWAWFRFRRGPADTPNHAAGEPLIGFSQYR